MWIILCSIFVVDVNCRYHRTRHQCGKTSISVQAATATSPQQSSHSPPIRVMWASAITVWRLTMMAELGRITATTATSWKVCDDRRRATEMDPVLLSCCRWVIKIQWFKSLTRHTETVLCKFETFDNSYWPLPQVTPIRRVFLLHLCVSSSLTPTIIPSYRWNILEFHIKHQSDK